MTIKLKNKPAKKAAAKKSPPPSKPTLKGRSTLMADAPAPDTQQPLPNNEPDPNPPPAPDSSQNVITGDANQPTASNTGTAPPPDFNPPTGTVPVNTGSKTPPPGPPYGEAPDAAAEPVVPGPDAPRSYPMAAGATGPHVVTGLRTAQDVADDLAGISDEERESRMPWDGNASTNAKTVPAKDRVAASKDRSVDGQPVPVGPDRNPPTSDEEDDKDEDTEPNEDDEHS